MIHLFLTSSFVKVIRFMAMIVKEVERWKGGGGKKEKMLIFLDSIR